MRQYDPVDFWGRPWKKVGAMTRVSGSIQDVKNFKALLDQQHDWPCEYVFKFIVTAENEVQLKDLFDESRTLQLDSRPSKNGRYTSVTARVHMTSSDEVVDLYIRASRIDGIISL